MMIDNIIVCVTQFELVLMVLQLIALSFQYYLCLIILEKIYLKSVNRKNKIIISKTKNMETISLQSQAHFYK